MGPPLSPHAAGCGADARAVSANSGELESDLMKLVTPISPLHRDFTGSDHPEPRRALRASSLTRDADIVAFTTDLNAWGEGVQAQLHAQWRFSASPFAGTKYTSWSENLTFNEIAHERGFDEFILAE